MPVRDTNEVEVECVGGARALVELLRYPRTAGWVDPGPVREAFDVLARVAAVVPVYRARLPWGPPFPPGVAERLLDAVAGVGP
jgi:hypothetical protein